jgi:16S rRNA (cytosine967-C5)-methyltransferase
MNSARTLALSALTRWRNGTEFVDRIIEQTFELSGLGASDRGFALELFYGVLRNLRLLDFWIGQLRAEPIEARARDLLRLGLYQIMFLQTPAHAAVFETVELARPRVRNLINAILRRALREEIALTNAADTQPLPVRFSEPEFLVEKWTRQFGAQATLELCQWNNRPAPIYARVNQLRMTVADFLHRYPGSFALPGSANFVGLPDSKAVPRNGDAYVQDPSTAIACEMLRPSPGEHLLDTCAAPGGKTVYLAEMMANQGLLVAADLNDLRLARLRDNLVRLGVTNVRPVQCDWRDENSIRAAGLAQESFDKILIDAPCTNTGVMRRRVDVRWRLQPDDFIRMSRRQLVILRAAAKLLKFGGSLVYSTCSLEPEENDGVIAEFLGNHPDFRLTDRRERLPFRDQFDGAFVARLELAA